jgi:FAD-dependent monooxygenase
MAEFLADDPHLPEQESESGRALREKIQQHYALHDGENKDIGIEMDHRHVSSVYPAPNPVHGPQPPWDPSKYIPSTFIGSRAPHVYLKNGDSIFDYYGPHWTLIQFKEDTNAKELNTLLQAANQVKLPLKHVVLKEEHHARRIWTVPLVLVRPDGHVAWRGHDFPDPEAALAVMSTVGGWKKAPVREAVKTTPKVGELLGSGGKVVRQVDEYKLDRMGVMQT